MFEKIISKNTEEPVAPKPIPSHPGSRPALPSVSDPSRPVAISAGQRNVLLPDVEIEGEVRFENDLLVDGKIVGKITSDGSLTIGEPAKIKAEINCGSVTVYGRVQGNITVTDRVEIRAKAEVIGDIKAQSLVMEAGAIFVGASTIGTPKNRPAKPAGAKPATGNRPAEPATGNRPAEPASANRPAERKDAPKPVQASS